MVLGISCGLTWASRRQFRFLVSGFWRLLVGVSGSGGPLPPAVFSALVGPAVLVFDAVVVSAEWREVAVTRLTTIGDCFGVVGDLLILPQLVGGGGRAQRGRRGKP